MYVCDSVVRIVLIVTMKSLIIIYYIGGPRQSPEKCLSECLLDHSAQMSTLDLIKLIHDINGNRIKMSGENNVNDE